MIRTAILSTFCAAVLFSTGCISPCMDCNNCDGYSGGCGMGPLQRMGRSAVCGNGCGEVYADEWGNYPPACDPCETRRYGMVPAWRSFLGLRCDDCETCYAYDNVERDGCFQDEWGAAACAQVGMGSCRGHASGCADCGGGIVSEGVVTPGCTSCAGGHVSGTHGANAGEVIINRQPTQARRVPTPAQPFQKTRASVVNNRK